MEQALDAKRNGVAFRRPVLQIHLRKLAKKVWRSFELMGYARACAELGRLGYHEQAKHMMMSYIAEKKI